jgi:SAM-dependent methyltransferase
MDRHAWDRRYAESTQLWSEEPNIWVRESLDGVPPGRALDIAAGEGRNALWLAEQGWQVTAVDFAQVALDRGRESARRRLGDGFDRIAWVHADVLNYQPEPRSYDVVLVVYLHLAPQARQRIFRSAADAVKIGGLLLAVAHDRENLTGGVGGPQDPTVLYAEHDLVADLDRTGLQIRTNEVRRRAVETAAGERYALDRVVLAVRHD